MAQKVHSFLSTHLEIDRKQIFIGKTFLVVDKQIRGKKAEISKTGNLC